jgi:hypothetical protein
MTVSFLDVASAAIRWSALPERDQERAFCAGMLDGGAHHRVEQLLKGTTSAGDGLRYLDHGRQVELFDGRRDRARRDSGSFFHLQMCG